MTKTPASKKSLPLTVLILTHRVNSRLELCLHSVQSLPHIILLATAPELNLSRLARRYHCRVVHLASEVTDFAAIRTQALSHAKTEWVLLLDSDEVLEPTGLDQLPHLLAQTQIAGYSLWRRDVFYGRVIRWGEVGRVHVLRLVRTHAVSFRRPIHEQVLVNGQTQKSPLVLWHYSHEDISAFITRVGEFARREAAYRFEHGHTSSLFELVFYPPAKFLLNYGLKLGFLDGWRGLVYALVMSIHSLAVRAHGYELRRQAHTPSFAP